MIYEVVIIGGGAAGFFAAINLSLAGEKVLILEKSNKVLSKVKVSGGGRCNVTHACFEPRELAANYPRGEKELLGPFHRFYTSDTIEWFAERGIELKIEEDGRMFPITDSSQTIIDCFIKEQEEKGIKLWKQAEVVKVEKEGLFKITLKDGQLIESKRLVTATGGGNKAKHYDFIEALGHHVLSPIPSLFTFNLKGHASNALMGISHEATVHLKGTNFEASGPVLFTHWGMSGPAILKLSAQAAAFLHQKHYEFDYAVCWLPNAQRFINEHRKVSAAQSVLSTKPTDFTKRFWLYLLERAKIEQEKNWADLTAYEMELLKAVLEEDIYHAKGKTTFKEEFVSCGGVDLKEINPKTMESKLLSGLYFCGEVMNVDALTGGFNFQAAWTTAWLVAQKINQELVEAKV